MERAEVHVAHTSLTRCTPFLQLHLLFTRQGVLLGFRELAPALAELLITVRN